MEIAGPSAEPAKSWTNDLRRKDVLRGSGKARWGSAASPDVGAREVRAASNHGDAAKRTPTTGRAVARAGNGRLVTATARAPASSRRRVCCRNSGSPGRLLEAVPVSFRTSTGALKDADLDQ